MLKELTESFGVSGDEQQVRGVIKKSVEKRADRMFEDDFGNLFVLKGKRGKKIMVVAHTDEVGVMIVGIERGGLLRFKTVGGLDPRVIIAKTILIGKNRVPGVIGLKPIHLTKPEEIKKAVSLEHMFIDIGAGSKEEAEKSIGIGDCGTFDTKFREDGEVVMGKAFDDRIGCYNLIELLKRDFDAQIIGVFSVQEELGLKGAKIAGFRMHPDCAIAVEVTATNDLPTEKDVNRVPFLRKGPVITVADQSVICDRELVHLLVSTAEKNNIPFQIKPPMIGGTDAGAVHLQHGGIRAVVVATPARYIHSPCSIASRSDIRNTNKLLALAVEKIIREVRCS